MPLYEYECYGCRRTLDRVFKVDDFPQEIKCKYCGCSARKIISRPQNMKPCWEPYYDENLGVMVKGREHRRSLMKQQGLEDKYVDPTTMRLRKEEREYKKREGLKHGK